VCSLRPAIAPDRYKASFPLEFLNFIRKGKRFDPPLQNAVEGGPLVKRYAKPVFDDAGIFLGAIVTDCDMDAVEEILRGVQVGRGGGAFIEDLDGNRLLGLERTKANSIFRGEMPILEEDGGVRWRVVVTAPAREFLAHPLRNILLLTVLDVHCRHAVSGGAHCPSGVGPDGTHPPHGRRNETVCGRGPDVSVSRDLKSRELDVLAASFNLMAETLEARNRAGATSASGHGAPGHGGGRHSTSGRGDRSPDVFGGGRAGVLF
jgi:hypothetical protein